MVLPHNLSSEEAQSNLEDLVENLIEAGNCVAGEIRALTEPEPANQIEDPANVADDPPCDSEDIVKPAVDQPETEDDKETSEDDIS